MMTFQTSSNKSVSFYIPSYKRSDSVLDKKILPNEYVTYVVRKSEEELYSSQGVNVIAVEDEKINTLGKVRQWILDNSTTDIVVQIDDDLKELVYVFKKAIQIIPQETVLDELLRVAQIIVDLKLGFAAFSMNPHNKTHIQEFMFKGVIGGVCIYNKSCIKSRYEPDLLKVDADFTLQELLHNRIMIMPDYMGFYGLHDKNKGGNNVVKDNNKLVVANEYLKKKWGKYYDFNYQTNKSKIQVKR